MPLLLNNAEQEQCITAIEAIDAIEVGYRAWGSGDAIRRGATFQVLPSSKDDHFLVFASMEGGLRGPGYYALRVQPQVGPTPGPGQKIVAYTYAPGYYGGLVLLFSTDTGELLSIMNDGFVQHLRVAATGAAGAKHMARHDSKVLGILGAGGMARTFAMTIPAIRGIERVLVWSPTRKNVDAYIEEMRPKVDAEFVAAEDAEAAVSGADIVCACTNSFAPVVEPEWVRPGTHLNSVLPGELFKVYPKIDAAGLLVRKPPTVLGGFQDADFRLTAEIMSWVGGTEEERARMPKGLAEPVTYPNARIVDCVDPESGTSYADGRDPSEITYLSNVSYGTLPGEVNSSAGPQGIQFSVVGGRIYDRARELGLGRDLPREWFLETTYTYSKSDDAERNAASA